MKRHEYTQIHMGVPVRLVVYTSDESQARRACDAAYERIAQLEQIMSDYRPTSELMQLCDRAGSGAIVTSPELFFVLQHAQQLAEETDGAFDVTVGPVVKLWRAARKEKKLPSDESLREAMSRTGWRNMKLNPRDRTVELSRPGMRLDLGGIGKGYAGDQAIAVLKQNGIKRAMYEAGGDIVVSAAPPGEKGWKIEVSTAMTQAASKLAGYTKEGMLVIRNCAVSTSGDTVQFVMIDGKRYSHVIDPRTGIGLTDRVMSTVIAPDGVTSDSVSTALTVLGLERGREFLKKHPRVNSVMAIAED